MPPHPTPLKHSLEFKRRYSRDQWFSIWFGGYCRTVRAVVNVVIEEPQGVVGGVVSHPCSPQTGPGRDRMAPQDVAGKSVP